MDFIGQDILENWNGNHHVDDPDDTLKPCDNPIVKEARGIAKEKVRDSTGDYLCVYHSTFRPYYSGQNADSSSYEDETLKIIAKAKAEIMEWISQQTEEERQDEEAREKEWVWRTHLRHNAKLFHIKGYDAPTLTAMEYNKKVASIRRPYKPVDHSQFLAGIAVNKEAKMKEKEEQADEERKEEDQNEEMMKPDVVEAEMTKKEEKPEEEMKQGLAEEKNEKMMKSDIFEVEMKEKEEKAEEEMKQDDHEIEKMRK